MCLFFLCSPDDQVDRNLFGTWLVIGYQDRVSGRVYDGKSYSVDEAFKLYRMDEQFITEIKRGYVEFFGEIAYYDTLQEKLHTASIVGHAITMDDSLEFAYDVRSRCNAQFLKLTRWMPGIDRTTLTSVTVEMNEYCIRVDRDSLPSSWPGEDDVTIPDPECGPGDLMNW